MAEAITSASLERRLAAIAFADVAGFSRLMTLNDVRTVRDWQRLRETVIEPLIDESGGRVVDRTGDGLLIEFPSVIVALRWAVDVQQATKKAQSKGDDFAMILRVAVNVDDVIDDGITLSGDGVNVAARIHQAAEPGQVVVTDTVRVLVGNRLPVKFRDLGSPKLKNIDYPVRVYSVSSSTAEDDSALHHPYLQWSSRPSIAVMPFRRIGSEDDYFGEGITEDIIIGLSRSRSLHVIARASMWRYRDRKVEPQRVARELGVDYILDGTVRRSGQGLRINVELMHVSQNRTIWARSFDGSEAELFDFQDKIATTIITSLEPRLQQVEFDRVKARPTSSLDAYDCVLKAMSLLYEFTENSFRRSGQALERAMELDPSFARAYAYSAWRLNFLVAEQLSQDPANDSGRAIDHSLKAIRLDPEDPFALAVAGHILSFVNRRPEQAIELFDQALNIDSNSAFAWGLSADTLSYLGRPDEAIKRFRNVWRLNPFDRLNFFWWSGAGIAEFVAGRHGEAVAWLRKAYWANPRFVATLRMLAASQALNGEIEEAGATAQALLKVHPGFRVSRFVDAYPLVRDEDLERLRRGLLQAGLPE